MRAIIIDDKDARALLDQLRLESWQYSPSSTVMRIGEQYNMPKQDLDAMVHEVHRRFHYVVTGWLQDQGARTT
jgi:hypothetical protein